MPGQEEPVESSVTCSVIIPTYNMAEHLSSAVSSVLQGRLEACEVLVVDDGSTDHTEKIIRAFVDPASPRYDSRVQALKQPNRGKAVAVNLALSRFRGRYLTILDADDELPSDSLSVRLEAATASPRPVDMVIGGFEVFDDNVVQGYRRPPSTTSPRSLRRRFFLRSKTPFHLNSVLISRDLVCRVGGMDERLRRCQDIDYALRCLEAAETIVAVDRSVYRYRKYRNEVGTRLRVRLQTLLNRARVYRKNFRGPLTGLALALGVIGDLGKLLYNLFGEYRER